MKYCSEPLNLRKDSVKRVTRLNSWKDLLPNREREAKLMSYFTRIKENKVAFLNPNPFRDNYRFMTNRIVFKIIHGGEDIIHWFREATKARIVYLIRHPIAVTLSRKVYPRLPCFLENENYRKLFTSEQITLSEGIIRNGSDFEKGILSWCLQNYPPLKSVDRINWVTITYEELVINPQPVIDYLAETLELSNPEKMLQQICRPSSTVYQSDEKTKDFFAKSSKQQEHFWLISKWKERITEKQEKLAFDILKKFEIDVYNYGELLPSYNYLISKGSYEMRIN